MDQPPKPKKLSKFFKELEPIYSVGTLLEISKDYSDSIIFFNMPGASSSPENFFKGRRSNLKYASVIALKSGDMLYYLGSYRNKISNRMCSYHRFIYNESIVYALDDSFMEDLSTYFTVLV